MRCERSDDSGSPLVEFPESFEENTTASPETGEFAQIHLAEVTEASKELRRTQERSAVKGDGRNCTIGQSSRANDVKIHRVKEKLERVSGGGGDANERAPGLSTICCRLQ